MLEPFPSTSSLGSFPTVLKVCPYFACVSQVLIIKNSCNVFVACLLGGEHRTDKTVLFWAPNNSVKGRQLYSCFTDARTSTEC